MGRLLFGAGGGHVPGEWGIWLFIFGDMTWYCLMCVTYMTDRVKHVAEFNRAAGTLHHDIAAVNMILLLTSSLAVAYAVRAVRQGIRGRLVSALMVVAIACGLAFVVNKAYEYQSMWHAGYTIIGGQAFYMWYYILTWVHLTHLVAGIFVLRFMYYISKNSPREPSDIRTMEGCASFWHAVDLLWVILFPLLYLVR